MDHTNCSFASVFESHVMIIQRNFEKKKLLMPFLVHTKFTFNSHMFSCIPAGPRSAVCRAPDSLVRGRGFDTRSGNILSFLLPLLQEGQLHAVQSLTQIFTEVVQIRRTSGQVRVQNLCKQIED